MDMEKVINDLEAIWVCCKNRQNLKVYDEIDREMFTDWVEIIGDAIAMIKEQKAVVRCKDCHYWSDAGILTECSRFNGMSTDEYFFCAYGKPKDGDGG